MNAWTRLARSRPGPLASAAAFGLFVCAAPLMPCPAAFADAADDQYKVAAGHYARQRWDLAAEEFGAFLRDYPDDRRADASVFYLAEALLQAGRNEQAEARFRQYLKRQAEGKFARPALFRAGEAAYLSGKTDVAWKDLRTFREQYPDDPLNAYILPYLGDIAMGRSNPKAAASYFRAALEQFPKDHLQDDCQFGLARALEKLGQIDEAAKLYRHIAGNRGSQLADDAYFHLAVLQFAQRRYDAALASFDALQREFVDSRWQPKTQLGRSWALIKLGRFDEAEQSLRTILEHREVGVEARYWLGMLQRQRGQWADAARTLIEAAAAAQAAGGHKMLDEIRYHAGDSLLRAGELPAAVEQFDRLLASDAASDASSPWRDDAVRGKIEVALKAKNYAVVEQQARRFQQLFPDSPLRDDIRRMLARSLIEQRKFQAATEVLEPMVALDLKDERGLEDRYLMAAAQKGLGQLEQALLTLRPVLDETASGDETTKQLRADAQLLAGTTLLALERYPDAVAPLQSLLATDVGDEAGVRARGALAICYARTGKLEAAEQLFNELKAKRASRELLVPVAEQLAEAAYAAEDISWSVELFDWLRNEAPTDAERQKGLSGLAWSQMKSGRLAEAVDTFGKLLDANPPEAMAAEAALARGRVFQRLGKFDPALAMYDRVIDRYASSPEYPQALLAAARLRHQLDQNREAAGLYALLAERAPDLPERDAVLYEWSWVRWDLDEKAAANDLLVKLRRDYPKSPYWADATYRLAQRAFEAADYDRAEQLADEVIGADPPADAKLREYAMYLSARVAAVEAADSGDWELVRRRFQRLLEAFAGTSQRLIAEYWIAESYYREDDFATAAKHFDDLAKRIADRDEAWMAMIPLRQAQLLAHRGNWQQAYDVASTIRQRFPDFAQQYEADYVMGRALAAKAELEDAREAYRRVLNSPTGGKTETAAMARWMIGEAYFHQKKFDAAMREYLRLEILNDYPKWQAAALLQAGKCRELLGEPTQAALLYKEVIRKFGTTEFAARARTALHELQQSGGDPEAARRRWSIH